MDLPALNNKETRLKQILQDLGSVIVAYSGGVDSSLLSYFAREVLKEKARIVIAVSPSLSSEELEAARAQALSFNFALTEITTKELENPDYQRNDALRCYFCKKTLFTELAEMAVANNIAHVAYGAIMDDKNDFRPGHKAALEYKVVSPLQDALLSKEEIRYLARQAGLPSWNRPQAACLSSRFPTFEPVTHSSLTQVERAEQYLHSLGFKQVRVRHHGNLARIEIDPSELPALSSNLELMKDVSASFKEIGYQYVTLDMEGYRRGSSNASNSSAGVSQQGNQPSKQTNG